MRLPRRRFVGPLMVVVMMAGLLVPSLARTHPLWETDRDCGPVIASDAHALIRFEPVVPPAAAEHCAFCHWLRAVGGASPSAFVSATPGLTTTAADVIGDDRVARATSSSLQSSRAPPAIA
jgi:hypothetical protein